MCLRGSHLADGRCRGARRWNLRVTDCGNMVDPALVIGHMQLKGNPVSSMQLGQRICFLYPEGHGHGGHVIGDGLVCHHYALDFGPQLPHHPCSCKTLGLSGFSSWSRLLSIGDGVPCEKQPPTEYQQKQVPIQCHPCARALANATVLRINSSMLPSRAHMRLLHIGCTKRTLVPGITWAKNLPPPLRYRRSHASLSEQFDEPAKL